MSIWVEPKIICSQKYRFKNPLLIKVTNKKDYFLSPYLVALEGLLPFLTYYNRSKKNSEIWVPGVLYTHMRHFLIILLIYPWLCFFSHTCPAASMMCPPDGFWDDLPPSITPFAVDPRCVLESLLGDVWMAVRNIEWNAVGWGKAVWVRGAAPLSSVSRWVLPLGAAGGRRSRWVLILLGSSLWTGLTLTCVSQ